MSESKSAYNLAWILIISFGIVWLGILVTGLIGLFSNVILGFIGILAFVCIFTIVVIVCREQCGDKESEYYSKHIEK